jgi:hypothetical protein
MEFELICHRCGEPFTPAQDHSVRGTWRDGPRCRLHHGPGRADAATAFRSGPPSASAAEHGGTS